MKGECNSKRKENFLSYYNLSDRIIFWTKQAASGNRKAVFIAPVGTVFIYENNAILCSANQSRDAKSCVSQAMIRYLFGRWNAFRCHVFCSWDARFCVSTGWRHCCYWWETAWWYAQQTKVETQNFASHKRVYAICWGVEMPFVAALFVRETQDFASLLGGRHHYFV